MTIKKTTPTSHPCLHCGAAISARARRCPACRDAVCRARRNRANKARAKRRRAGAVGIAANFAVLPRFQECLEAWLQRDYVPSPASEPTALPPGRRRVAVYSRRVEAGEAIFHPADRGAYDQVI